MNTEGNMNLEPAQREIVAFWSVGAFGGSRKTITVSICLDRGGIPQQKSTVTFPFSKYALLPL